VPTRIGVLADTHCPEFIERLPDRVSEVLQGVEVIIHAGDVTGRSTLAELERIARVEAVRGDHDAELAELPASRQVVVQGKRIVITHGHRSRWLEEPATFLWTVSLGYFHPHGGLPRSLRRRFPEADVIVFGHTHRSHMEVIDGALLFNPGAVHQWNPVTARRRLTQKPGWFEWWWLQIARYLRSYPKPSVGILELEGDRILPRVIEL
jgi:putative phosphoesterase